ncbi:MAG TPA: type II secretion system F family protein, partial [Verrucomicrobiae bacterium]|nr:type II secretion system F family protein [Verrucomicrobiae bacterium]
MPHFQYLAVDADGQRKSGGVDAANEAAARALLVRRRLLPVQIDVAESGKARTREASPSPPVRGAKLNQKTLMLVTRQLSTLINAAVPVDEALAMIAVQQEQPMARRIISDVQAGVLEGQRLADALGRHPATFSMLYRSAVAGGERAGRLDFVLNRLADYLARAHAMRSKVTTAMIYPAALSLVALTVVICLMIFVVPSLTEQFERFDQNLPLLTQILIGVS